MPVNVSSRYYGSAVYPVADAAGAVHPTIALRPPAPPAPGTTIYRHLVTGMETIEYLAWRYYGSSALWWRIAEANDLTFPLVLEIGSTLNIPGATDAGLVVRTRSFG